VSSSPICPCGAEAFPVQPANPPGRSSVLYRAGDFASFRHALLTPLAGETNLAAWRPSASDDLGVQIVEWWAYLADILTFYNERYANESYLRTATWPESVRALVRLLGYRPRPGIGATGSLAALIKGPKRILIPAGFAIQSKPGPGETPQTFLVDADTAAAPPDSVGVDVAPDETVVSSALLRGDLNSIRVGEPLLLINRGWSAQSSDYALPVQVASVTKETDPRGNRNTRVTFTQSAAPPAGLGASSFRLVRGLETSPVWPYSAPTVISSNSVHLASIQRAIAPNDLVVVESAGSGVATLRVDTNSEPIWYANPKNTSDPTTPPDPPAVPIGIPHSLLAFGNNLTNASTLDGNRSAVRVRFDFRDVGTVIPTPAASASGSSLTLEAAGGEFPAVTAGQQVLLQDANGDGALGTVVAGSATSLSVQDIPPDVTLKAPLQALFGLLSVSRGKNVASEVLGSGDATAAGQMFQLQKSPLTYLPGSTAGYRSTLRIWVDGIEWTEAPSFYAQPADAHVFVTSEDDKGKTSVQFGDGVNGARLPSGTSNVTAQYRYGSGKAVPAAGKLTVIARSLDGLRSVLNPVPPSGGDDPDPPDRLRTFAPRSVVTFQRAVSAADFEALAVETPGVDRARAYWSFDTTRQQTVVTVYVGDTDGAVTAARQGLQRATDPNRALVVLPAVEIDLEISLHLLIASDRLPDPVSAAVRAALLDADTGLLGTRNTRIGQNLFRSQIFAACLAVPGVTAVHSLIVKKNGTAISSYKIFAGEGGFFQVAGADLDISAEVADES